MPCNQEEADSHIFMHLADAALIDHKKIMVQAVDTDVVLLVFLAVVAFYVIDIDEL